MRMKVRPYKRRPGWHEVDIRWKAPDGTVCRDRTTHNCSKTAAMRWGDERVRALISRPSHGPTKEVPTLEAFAERFMQGHALANRHKSSGIAQKRTALRVHLIPALGRRKLHAIANEDVSRLKHDLRQHAPKTVNNVLTVLNTLLKKAVEWGVIERMPCTVALLKVPQGAVRFFGFADYEALVAAAARVSPEAHLAVLLGGDAGLRGGEIRALEWTDVNFGKRQLCVERNDWRGQVSTTKGGRIRYVALTTRLWLALKAHRHMRGPRVLYRPDGRPFVEHQVVDLLKKVGRVAGLRIAGTHILRHTFCSHLAMRGAPARAIQELAGHKDLMTTQRYMHLSPNAIHDAIRLLEAAPDAGGRGDIVETATGTTASH